MTVRYPTLEDYLHTAAYVLDLSVETVTKMARLDLAESALHAPQAGWGDVEFYPDLPMKAAVLLVRLAKNHALPDGNKRAALATTIAFCDVNGYDWTPPSGDGLDGEETYQVMLSIAGASSEELEAVEAEVADWIADRLRPRPSHDGGG
jgi:death-on-curing protein